MQFKLNEKELEESSDEYQIEDFDKWELYTNESIDMA